jgi:hypothetical protein
VGSCVGARAWLESSSSSLTLFEEIMVTAVKMSRPYTAIDLMRRIYRQMYLGEHQHLASHQSQDTRGGQVGGQGEGSLRRMDVASTHLRRVRKSVLWNSRTLTKSNCAVSSTTEMVWSAILVPLQQLRKSPVFFAARLLRVPSSFIRG